MGEIRVLRSRLSDRSRLRDQNFSIARGSVFCTFDRVSNIFIRNAPQIRSRVFSPHRNLSRNSCPLLLQLESKRFRSHMIAKHKPRSVAHPFAENRDPDPGPQPTMLHTEFLADPNPQAGQFGSSPAPWTTSAQSLSSPSRVNASTWWPQLFSRTRLVLCNPLRNARSKIFRRSYRATSPLRPRPHWNSSPSDLLWTWSWWEFRPPQKKNLPPPPPNSLQTPSRPLSPSPGRPLPLPGIFNSNRTPPLSWHLGLPPLFPRAEKIKNIRNVHQVILSHLWLDWVFGHNPPLSIYIYINISSLSSLYLAILSILSILSIVSILSILSLSLSLLSLSLYLYLSLYAFSLVHVCLSISLSLFLFSLSVFLYLGLWILLQAHTEETQTPYCHASWTIQMMFLQAATAPAYIYIYIYTGCFLR